MAVWSGDTVVADADGLLRFVGRDDEMIKSAGNRISPTEIEEAVTGRRRNDARRSRSACRTTSSGQAILVVAKGDGSAEAALRDRLRRELPNFMQPVALCRGAPSCRAMPTASSIARGLKGEVTS